MSMYRTLRFNPPKLTVKKDVSEVIFKMVSCMCDNKSNIVFYKDKRDNWRCHAMLPSRMGYALSNYQMKGDSYDLEYLAEEGNWDSVIKLINSGTAVISSVLSR